MSSDALPAGWSRTTLAEVTAPKVEQTGPEAGSKQFVYVDIGSIGSAKAISARQLVPTPDAASRARQKLKAGDVLVSMTRPNLNAVAMVPPEFDGAIGSTGFHVLRAQIVEARYLFAVVRGPGFVGAMTELVQGALYPAVRPDDVRGFEVALPPLAEQKRIVAKIEELMVRSRRAKEALEAVPMLLNQLRQSILAAAFRGDLTADWRAKHPDLARREALESFGASLDDLPKRKKAARSRTEMDALAGRAVPPEWRMGRLFEVAEVQLGQRRAPEYAGATEYPYIRAANIKWDGLELSDVKTMGFADPAPLMLAPGDVLLTEASGSATEVGKPAIWRGEIANCCFQATVLRLRANRTFVLPEWLYYSMLADARLGRFAAMAPGVGILHLTSGRMREWPVSLPTLEEQQVICNLLERALANINDREEQLTVLVEDAARMDASILAAAFRGKLVPQEPSDEPASALLERIRSTRESIKPNGAGSRRRSRKADVVDETPNDADDDGGHAPMPPLRSTPGRHATKDISDLDQEAVHDEVFAALWTQGALEKDDAVRRVAEHLREAGYVEFHRLRSDGPLYAQFLVFIESSVKAGRLDRPKRGQVRACKADATSYTADDWRHALVASLGNEPADREDAIRVAAEWARNHLGLEFSRLRSDGHIVEGLRSAINSAIRRGEVVRHDAKCISRAPSNGHGVARRSGPAAYRISLSMMDGDFVVHEMGKFFCVDGKIVVPPENSSNWMIAELREGIVGPDDKRLTFEDGEAFINNIAFAWKKWPRYCSVEPASAEDVARLLGGADV